MDNTAVNYFTCTLGQAVAFDQAASVAKTIGEFLSFQAKRHPELPAAAFPVPKEGEWRCEIFSFGDLDRGSENVALELVSVIKEQRTQQCVALLCPSSVDFLFAWLALMKLGVSVLLIAPQCNPSAIRSLCESCDASHLLHDISYSDLASTAVKNSYITAETLPWQTGSKDLVNLIRADESDDVTPYYQPIETDTAYIHHSSGTSTGIPKPIPQSHRAGFGVLPRLDGRNSATFTTTPLYHGGVADCFRAWTSNALIWLFPGGDLPITPKNIISCVEVAKQAEKTGMPPVKYFSSVPYILQMLSEEARGMEMLRLMDLVGVGGAALSQSVGDNLVNHGVKLVSRFGSAECGFLLSSHRDYSSDKFWQYLRAPASDSTLTFENHDRDNGLKQLIVNDGWPHMAKRNRPDKSYATSDLFERHTHIENAWKYNSRSDSQITLLTGKKFDPAPLEDAISGWSSIIREAVIFGGGKQYPGALIFLSTAAGPGAESEVWEAVSQSNNKAENHSRINRDMLVLLSADEHKLEKSSKGTVLRGPTETKFAKYIEKKYGGGKEGHSKLILPANIEEAETMISQIVEEALGSKLSATQDFYQAGVDSSRATQIRSKLQAMSPDRTLPGNVLYDSGNIKNLSRFIMSSDDDLEAESMADIVRKFATFDNPPSPNAEFKENGLPQLVVLTGATGSLGAHILNNLNGIPAISEIICLVRGKSEVHCKARVAEALVSRKIPDLTDSDKIKCFPSMLGSPDLGLPPEVLEKIKNERVSLIHAAWAVNFSISLHSFIPEHITGLHNLLNLAVSCPRLAQFTFCSSTASIIQAASPIPEILSTEASDADDLGYSKSKWIAEQICASATKVKNMRGKINIVRIGQLTGDTRNGAWSMSEAWPLMLSTVRELKCLPNIKQKLDWLPVDVAAEAVVDITLAASPRTDTADVYHVVQNSSESDWNGLLGWLARREEFEIVEPTTWMERLEGMEQHPAKSLLWLWNKAYGLDGGGGKDVKFKTEKAMLASKALRNSNGVDEALMVKLWTWISNQTSQI
ncbi:Adenylate-forming reductase Nps10 [Lachnellula suecica]|uniref:Adenylate-forming reductase Nps10 n=1 Tax=Lachnellula suecica TaxID=602035 RepID=A0A8T9C368_9HELO|nr:Adenylate-forming reductase Nps10 [Lachnellula suecica]